MKRFTVAALAIALPLTALPAAAQTFTMKLAGIASNDPAHEYLKLFKERIESRTNGRIKGEVYPGAQLGGYPRLIEGAQLGTVELFMGPPGFMRGVDPRVQIVDAPGLFDGAEHAQATFTDPKFRDPFLNVTTAKGITGVTLYAYGATSYASTSPLRRLDDFRGKKIRVLATRVETETMARVGASGVPMDFAEVLPALQGKVIDGVRSNKVILGAIKMFTVARYVTDVRDSWIAIGGFVSAPWLDKLPSDLKRAVLDVGRELDADTYRLALAAEERAAQMWRENGAEVIELPHEEQAEFLRRARAVADEVLGTDPALKDMYELYKQVAQSHRKKL